MNQVERVRRLARVLFVVAIVVMGFVMVGTIFGLVVAFPTAASLQVAYPDFAVSPVLSQRLIVGSIVFGLVPALVWIWTLDQMRRLFGCYKSGAILTDLSARFIQRIGIGFLVIAITELVLVPIQSVLLTASNPVGERAINISLNSDMFGFLIAAGLMTVIGWAMREASAVVAENKAFV